MPRPTGKSGKSPEGSGNLKHCRNTTAIKRNDSANRDRGGDQCSGGAGHAGALPRSGLHALPVFHVGHGGRDQADRVLQQGYLTPRASQARAGSVTGRPSSASARTSRSSRSSREGPADHRVTAWKSQGLRDFIVPVRPRVAGCAARSLSSVFAELLVGKVDGRRSDAAHDDGARVPL